jgi:WD40 repeat protein
MTIVIAEHIGSKFDEMEKLIRGEITRDVMEEMKRVLPKKNLMVFVSSTFLDTTLERDILHRTILPDLQRKAQQHEIQIVFYDMRFGVKDENTLDHMTWVACKEAIKQCYDGSDGLFFLSLQADRYGYLPLPKYLDEAVLSQSRNEHENDLNFPEVTKFLDEWYKLDENQCPPRYELKALSSLNDPTYWRIVLPTLRDTVLNSVPFETLKVLPEEIVVNRSVTQWETFYGLDCDKDRFYWIQRVFGKTALRQFKDSSDCWKITDIFSDESNTETTDESVRSRSTAKKLEVLHAKMKMYLREDQRVELSPRCSPEAYLKGEGCEEYLEEWERVTRDCLEKELKKVIEKLEQWNAGFAGIPVDHLGEIFHHGSIAFTKANSFLGRDELLGEALEMVKKTREVNETRLPICTAVIGKSGCGKTALMSKLALSLSGAKEIPMIIRFCGTSRYSLNGLKLVQSISLQILATYEKQEELKEFINDLPSQNYKTAVEYFQKLVSKYPIYLLIDSLDQLENRYEERSKLTFLRDLKPHEQSSIIVSTLPDEYEENGKPSKYFYQCERTLTSGSVPILDVGIMNQVEAILNSLLTSRQKKLTDDQWIVTLQAISHEPTILYINLAMEVISQWRSFDKEVILRPTVKGLIHQIFGDLEVSYGKEFTSIAFAMITFSREGVNDPELKDLLSLHEGVMAEVCQYSKLHCFPMHAWLRLKQVIKNLVTEKENNCIKWYHRQLWETASERYSEKEKECHEIMGKYFTNLVDIDMKKEKDIMTQPLILNEVSVWVSESIVNRRRVVEGYYHLIKGGLLQEAVEEVCSLEFVCCSALAGDLLNCVRLLGELVRVLRNDNDIPQQLDHYYRWMRKRATKIAVGARRQTRMTAGEEPLISVVKKKILQLEERERNELGYTLEPMTFSSVEDFDALEIELVGHHCLLSSITWNHDDSKILSSGSLDNTIKLWDSMTGELLNTLEGHSNWVNSVSWNHDSSKIASGSRDETVKIWDGVTCEVLMTLKDADTISYKSVSSVAWSHDSSKIASAAADGKVRIWDPITGKLLNTLSGHTNPACCVSWSHDNSKLLSGSEDDTIQIWNTLTGELLKTMKRTFYSYGSFVPGISASWNHDSRRIVSGSGDGTIKIWDVETGELLKSLEECAWAGISVGWNNDGSRILSGTRDRMNVWNAFSGELEGTIFASGRRAVWNKDCSRIATSGLTSTIQVWDSTAFSNRSEVTVRSLTGRNPGDSRRIMAGMEDGTIRIWDGVTGQLVKRVKCHSGAVTYVTWNHDGTRFATLSTDRKNVITVWNGVTYGLLLKFEVSFFVQLCVECFSWNHDSTRIFAVASGKQFFLWNGKTGKLLNARSSFDRPISAIFWNHDITKIATISSYGLSLWDGKITTERQLTREEFSSVFWAHHSSRFFVQSLNKQKITIYDAESGGPLKTLSCGSDRVTWVSWTRDDSKILLGSWGTIQIWDGATGQLLTTERVSMGIIPMSLSLEDDRIYFYCYDGPFVRCSITKIALKPVCVKRFANCGNMLIGFFCQFCETALKTRLGNGEKWKISFVERLRIKTVKNGK